MLKGKTVYGNGLERSDMSLQCWAGSLPVQKVSVPEESSSPCMELVLRGWEQSSRFAEGRVTDTLAGGMCAVKSGAVWPPAQRREVLISNTSTPWPQMPVSLQTVRRQEHKDCTQEMSFSSHSICQIKRAFPFIMDLLDAVFYKRSRH